MRANRMSDFKVFIGTWNTKGEVLRTVGAPATMLLATDTYRWLPGKYFIVHEVDARFGEQPNRSMEVMGYDLESKKYFARSFDDQGASEVFKVALEGRCWSIIGDTVRFSGHFDVRHMNLSGLWERKNSKAGWQPWIKLALKRADSRTPD